MNPFAKLKGFCRRFMAEVYEQRYARVAARYNINGYRRVYFVHVRKTGGTSLNHMFLALSGEDPARLYQYLSQHPLHRLMANGLIYAGWMHRAIERGNYFYAFSHFPLHQIDLPDRTFTVTCLRDPARRVVSHYKMLLNLRDHNPEHPCMKEEGTWLGGGFSDFLDRIPREHLLRQIYMFSRDFDVDEAALSISKLSQVIFLNRFSDGVEQINQKTGLALQPLHIRKASRRVDIPSDQMARLKELVKAEYALLERLRTKTP